ncbi:MAG: hypothetical protein RLZZ262_2316 [Bacteroidota bacterium]|jgi:hypothetical protein
MKKFYFSICSLFVSVLAIAQCTATLTYTIDGNIVIATVTGTGANSPSFAIEWGDGTQELSASGTHTYADGTYTICGGMFDMSNPLGCADQDCHTITIGQGGGTDCMVNFTPVISGLTVAINATGTGASNPLYTITWGDGSPEEAGPASYHTYAAPGDYTICVLYIDDVKGGCIVENCQTVTLTELVTDCVVSLEVTVNSETGYTSVVATGEGAENPQYIIAWGDNSFPAIGSSATYTYSAAGSYELCVTYLDVNAPLACNVTECETVDITLGVDEIGNWNAELSVYPVPAQDLLNIELKGALANDLRFDLFDSKGQLVSTKYVGSTGWENRKWEIAVGHLAQGMYTLRAQSSEGVTAVRFVK